MRGSHSEVGQWFYFRALIPAARKTKATPLEQMPRRFFRKGNAPVVSWSDR